MAKPLTPCFDCNKPSQGVRCRSCSDKVRTGKNSSNWGHIASELEIEALSKAHIKHGHGSQRNRSPTYRSWESMKRRCLNSNVHNYDRYGKRGITICNRWLEFENFLEDMGERPSGTTLDRKDNNGNYEPGNCRWATFQEQWKNQPINGLDQTGVIR